jgi:hypothetical protein
MECNRTPGAGPYDTGDTINNWAHNVSVTPQRFYHPSTVDELVSIVKEAEATGASVRTIGSAWSFTDIMFTPDYVVATDRLTSLLSETISHHDYTNQDDPVFGALTPAATSRLLCHVEAGITIHDLHDRLESRTGSGFENLQSVPVLLNTGPGGAPQEHGYALKTLGGSGGQSIVGAISTSTHGGDTYDSGGNLIRPLPDMVQGIHLVGPGGAEFFIQRGGARAIADPAMLATNMPCVAGRIISDDDVFNAAVVSMGRMGIIYSVVIEVRPQYVLCETRHSGTWKGVLAGSTLSELRRDHRFLQILLLPYPNSNGDHTCYITTRDEINPKGPSNAGPGFSLFTFACDNSTLMQVTIAGIVGALALAIAWFSLLGLWALEASLIALMAILAPLAVPGVTIGDYLAAALNIATDLGMLDFAEWLVNQVLSSSQDTYNNHHDLSYKIMDTFDYSSDCYKALSIEVAFNADTTEYQEYIQIVFDNIKAFAAQNILLGAYISLRYCGGSEALLAIEQWPHTVCIEISGLAGLDGEVDVLNKFLAEAVKLGAKVHWGQLNNLTRDDVDVAFPGKIDTWRATLAQLASNGSLATFRNDFCVSHGLDP